MPALLDIRRRIRSVKSTQQITKAMKMVSAAKLRRAQEAMFAARPYARKMMEVLNELAARAPAHAHPLLEERGRRQGPARGGDRGQGPLRRIQREHHPHRRPLHRRATQPGPEPRPRGPQGPGLLQATGPQGAGRARGGLPGLEVRDRPDHRQGSHRRLHRRARSTACSCSTTSSRASSPRRSPWSSSCPFPGPTSTPKSRPSTTSTSPVPRGSSRACCLATSRPRSGARSSSRPPPSTAPG